MTLEDAVAAAIRRALLETFQEREILLMEIDGSLDCKVLATAALEARKRWHRATEKR